MNVDSSIISEEVDDMNKSKQVEVVVGSQRQILARNSKNNHKFISETLTTKDGVQSTVGKRVTRRNQ